MGLPGLDLIDIGPITIDPLNPGPTGAGFPGVPDPIGDAIADEVRNRLDPPRSGYDPSAYHAGRTEAQTYWENYGGEYSAVLEDQRKAVGAARARMGAAGSVDERIVAAVSARYQEDLDALADSQNYRSLTEWVDTTRSARIEALRSGTGVAATIENDWYENTFTASTGKEYTYGELMGDPHVDPYEGYTYIEDEDFGGGYWATYDEEEGRYQRVYEEDMPDGPALTEEQIGENAAVEAAREELIAEMEAMSTYDYALGEFGVIEGEGTPETDAVLANAPRSRLRPGVTQQVQPNPWTPAVNSWVQT
jgi:hypothetical protein